MIASFKKNTSVGFTIVELLIVIVVIGILAAVTIVGYNGITNRAKVSGIQLDLENGAKKLELYRIGTSPDGKYPDDLAAAGLQASGDNVYGYFKNNNTTPPSFCLASTNSGTTYKITSTATTPVVGDCSSFVVPVTCSTGFVVVPGNTTFGTSDFCVMKYEARNVSGVATSQPTGAPWANISQTSAVTAANAACSGCHLLSDAEWMTIAANVLSVPSNWSGGSVGSGYIYQGHVNVNPTNALSATADDNDGLYGITGGTGGAGLNNRRTLTLSNGEVIWDLSGNVSEWTSDTIAGGQQPGVTGNTTVAYRQWNNSTLEWNGLPVTSRAITLASQPGLSSINSWTSTQGIGQLVSGSGDMTLRGFIRGANWNNSSYAGIIALGLYMAPSDVSIYNGFRVAK